MQYLFGEAFYPVSLLLIDALFKRLIKRLRHLDCLIIIADLVSNSDSKVLKHVSLPNHCLHHLLLSPCSSSS